MNILFITSNRLGDGVLSTGILNHLTVSYPQAHFTIAAGPMAAPLFADWPRVTQTIVFSKQKYAGHWFDLWRVVVGTKWDMVVDIRGSLISYILKTQKRYVWRKNAGDTRPKVEQLAHFLNLNQVPAPFLPTSQNRDDRVTSKLGSLNPNNAPLFILGPVANWNKKEWPLSSFADLTRRLTASSGPFPNGRAIILGAPGEHDRLMPLISELGGQCIDLVGQLDILDIGALLKKCSFFIGNDSGLMHLAAAAGCPTLGLFGPSPHDIYAPYGPNAAIVRTPEDYETLMAQAKNPAVTTLMANLSVDAVYDKIIDFLAVFRQKAS